MRNRTYHEWADRASEGRATPAEQIAILRKMAKRGSPHRGVARLLLATEKARVKDDARPGRNRENSASIKATRVAATGPVCESCAIVMPSASLLHIHHITPISEGGLDVDANCALLCPNCHAKAHWLHRRLTADARPKDATGLLSLLKSA
jgi:5-methylcytosine-specific restriction endonuclease McrA